MAASETSKSSKPAAKKARPKRGRQAAKKQAVAKNSPAAGKRKAQAKKPPAKKSTARKSAAAGKSKAKSNAAGYGREAWEKKPAASQAAEQPLMKTLRAEHRHIATVMQLFDEQLQSLEAQKQVDPHVLFEVMEYITTWPDRFHHPREDLIYSRVAELDAKAADDVDTLQRDHDYSARSGQKLLKDIAAWQKGEISAAAIVKSGREYISHTYEHMNVEEKVVFPHIEATLTLEDWRELAEDDALEAVSMPIFGPRVQREFRGLARRLRRGVRRQVERGAMAEWVGIEAVVESLEVLSLAYDSARASASTHFQTAVDDSKSLFRESPVSAPLRCSLNNLKLGYRLLGEVVEISRETLGDLEQVNEERKERLGLFKR